LVDRTALIRSIAEDLADPDFHDEFHKRTDGDSPLGKVMPDFS
jgi:hypothetical protein